MEKRTVLAFVLIFIIYWFSSQYLWKSTPAVQTESETRESTVESQPEAQETPSPQTFTASERSIFSSINVSEDEDSTLDHEIFLENERVKVSFSSTGALINQILLKDFYLADKVTNVTLIPEGQAIMQLYFANNVLSDINNVLFRFEKENTSSSQSVSFFVHDEDSHAIFRKVFTLYDDHRLGFHIEGNNLPIFDEYSVYINSGINITEHNKAAVKDIRNSFKFVTQVDRETREVVLSKLNRGEQRFSGTINWAAVRSKYFVMGLIPENKIMTHSVRTQKIASTLGFDLVVRYNSRISSISDHYELYFGPVDYDELLAFNIGMENIAELGYKWLRPLAKMFLYYISFLHRLIPNYGLVIIVFALTLKILLAPLTSKSLRSSREMQKLQPMLREIQAKYKNDVKKQQEELRNLYKEHNVSPLGGCLPLLLQMPIFFALYPVLRFSIDLRQANFFGWLVDLSEPDPYWILPIFMGIFMFIQQKMMQPKQQDSTSMDDKQAAMMQSSKMMTYMMPPFMVFIFGSLPSGLVLYWTVFNVFSIIQHYYLNKKHD